MSSKPPVLHTYNIAGEVRAFSTTRHGGPEAEPAYSAFNINPFCGDSPEHVAACREALCRELGVGDDRLVLPHQTHGVATRVIDAEFCALPPQERSKALEGVDAVMTAERNLCIGVSTADCIPVLLYDPAHHAVCAVHAGWRGTLARIAGKAVADMRAAFGTVPSELKAVVGPGISVEHFEVGDEVYEQFASAGFNMETISQRREKWHIDLPACNRMQMEEMGVKRDNITVSDVCTMKDSDTYFSARKLGTESGRIFTGIIIK